MIRPSSSWVVHPDGTVSSLSTAPRSRPRPRPPGRITDLVCVQCGGSFRGTSQRRLCSSACQDARIKAQVTRSNRRRAASALTAYEKRRAMGLCATCGKSRAIGARCVSCAIRLAERRVQ